MAITVDVYYWYDEAQWEEKKHPRANNGQFASTPGGGASAPPPGAASTSKSPAPKSSKKPISLTKYLELNDPEQEMTPAGATYLLPNIKKFPVHALHAGHKALHLSAEAKHKAAKIMLEGKMKEHGIAVPDYGEQKKPEPEPTAKPEPEKEKPAAKTKVELKEPPKVASNPKNGPLTEENLTSIAFHPETWSKEMVAKAYHHLAEASGPKNTALKQKLDESIKAKGWSPPEKPAASKPAASPVASPAAASVAAMPPATSHPATGNQPGIVNKDGAYEALPPGVVVNINEFLYKKLDRSLIKTCFGHDSPESYLKSIPASSRGALKKYSGSAYSEINAACRSGNVASSSYASTIKAMDTWFESPKAKLQHDAVVYRGTKLPSSIWQAVSAAVSEGKSVTFSDKGYASTSIGSTAALGFGSSGVVMRVTVKKGTPAAWLGTHLSHHPMEKEMLLPRGTKFRVKGKINVNGKEMLDVEVSPGG